MNRNRTDTRVRCCCGRVFDPLRRDPCHAVCRNCRDVAEIEDLTDGQCPECLERERALESFIPDDAETENNY